MPDRIGRPIVVDTRTGTIGILMAEDEGQIYLRPLHGGPEWTPPADRIRPATPDEIKAAQ